VSVFDATVDRYDEARPEYPAELIDELVVLAQLEPGDRLLEIGCATGKATRRLLERGFRVTCVEPGPSLAARAAATLDVDVHNARFEDWPGEPGAFDLVFAATAWHWLDPDTRYAKAHVQLKPGGHLAFWSALHAFPEGFDPFFTEIQAVYDEINETYPGEWPPRLAADDRAEIEASGHFGDVEVRHFLWELQYTADEYIALLETFSGHIEMTDAQRSRLYGEIRRRLGDRRVRRHWEAVLHVARRIG
jgi:SAM-dependent methyltransferase